MRLLPSVAAAAMIAALGMGAGVSPGMAADEPVTQNEDITKTSKKKKGRWAETGRPPGKVVSNRWGFYVGTYLADVSTDAAVGSGKLLGTFIRAEDDLGLGADDQALRIEGFYRFNPRHGLDIGYWGISRTGSRVIQEQIEFQDKIFEAGVGVNSEWKTSWFRLAYKYSMVNNRRAEAGITAGLSTYNFSLGLEGVAAIRDPNGVITATGFESLTESFLAPVPTFGFFLTYAMRPRLLFKLKADLLDLSISDIEGTLIDTSIGVEWYYSNFAGFGLMANTTSIEVKDTGDSPFNIDYKQAGYVAYFTFVFGKNGAKPGG